MFVRIKGLLKRSLKKLGIEKQVEAARVLEIFNQLAEEEFGSQIRNQVKPLYLKNKVLTVSVKNSVLASEFQLRQKQIIEKINQRFQKTVVSKLRFLL